MYRQLYRKGFEQWGRVQTFKRVPSDTPGVPDTWQDIGGDRNLGDAIEARGVEVDEGILRQEGPAIAPRLSLERPGPVIAQESVRRRLYILDIYAADRVVAADPLAGGTLAKVNLGQRSPVAILLSPDRTKLYVAHRSESASGAIPARPPALIVLDTDPLRISRRYDLPERIQPQLTERSLEITPDGKVLYLVNEGRFDGGFVGSTIVRIDAATGAILGEIAMPRPNIAFGALQMSPDGAVLYSASSSSRLFLIDVLTNTVSLDLFAPLIDSIALHPNGSLLYGSNPTGISVFDTVAAAFRDPIPVEGASRLRQLTISADGYDLFANDDRGGAIHHISLLENRVVGRIATPTAGSVIAMGR
ncbi:MAG: hypothetical protein IPM24_12640 [Bryobacterales bacterium]|nr:hypothetical protein [Bryobacterales bacterium]